MGMHKCPECQSEISSLASICPHCGFPLSDDKMKTRVGIPAMPKELWDGFQKVAQSHRLIKWHVGVGDWVKEGEHIASLNVSSFKVKHRKHGKIQTQAQILSPITGKVGAITGIEYANWDWSGLTSNGRTVYWESQNGNNNLTDSKMMIYIDTPKEPEYVSEVHAVFESVIDYGYFANEKMDATFFKKSVFGLGGVNDFPIKALEAFANSSLLVTRRGTADIPS